MMIMFDSNIDIKLDSWTPEELLAMRTQTEEFCKQNVPLFEAISNIVRPDRTTKPRYVNIPHR